MDGVTISNTKNVLDAGYAGGLVGINTGAITASYASGDLDADGSRVLTGGLVGENKESGGSITASFATGSHTTATDTDPQSGGLVGDNVSPATVTNSYWDKTTSGITTAGAGTGKTTSELQTPIAYGTGASIYKNWDIDLDTTLTGTQDPWNFGTASQYPILKYGALSSATQRTTVTLTLNPASICESSVGTNANACGASPVTSTTVTATANPAWHHPIKVTPKANAAYTAGNITIAAGATTAAGTLTAVNNKTNPTNDPTFNIGATIDDVWVELGTAPTLTIKDDDIAAKPTGVRLSFQDDSGTLKIRVDWNQVTDATGYTVQWTTANTDSGWSSPTGTDTKTSGSTIHHSITSGLTTGTTYYFRVIANATGYDTSPPSDVVDITTTAGDIDYDDRRRRADRNIRPSPAKRHALGLGRERRSGQRDKQVILRCRLPRRRRQHGLQRGSSQRHGGNRQPRLHRHTNSAPT